MGKAFAGKTVNVYAFSNGKAVLVASGVTVSKDGTVVVTVPADLKLGATKSLSSSLTIRWSGMRSTWPSPPPNSPRPTKPPTPVPPSSAQ